MNELTGAMEAQNVKIEQVQVEYQQAKQDCEAMKEVHVQNSKPFFHWGGCTCIIMCHTQPQNQHYFGSPQF